MTEEDWERTRALSFFDSPEPMECSENISCPFCGQSFEFQIDTSIPSQQFVTDCEICCRPFQVFAECEPGEILSLDVRGN